VDFLVAHGHDHELDLGLLLEGFKSDVAFGWRALFYFVDDIFYFLLLQSADDLLVRVGPSFSAHLSVVFGNCGDHESTFLFLFLWKSLKSESPLSYSLRHAGANSRERG
jgi:hypothetical protein